MASILFGADERKQTLAAVAKCKCKAVTAGLRIKQAIKLFGKVEKLVITLENYSKELNDESRN